MNPQEMMKMDKADLVWRILTLESKVEAQNILIKVLEDSKPAPHPVISKGSVWVCEMGGFEPEYFTKGREYIVLNNSDGNYVELLDDEHDANEISTQDLTSNFKRVS